MKETQSVQAEANNIEANGKTEGFPFFEVLFAAALVLLSAVIISVKLGYLYSTNDDAMLRNIVNGVYTGKQDAHMIYVMYPLAFLWKTLYHLFPKMEWYDISSVGLHYLCWFLIVAKIGTICKCRMSKIFSMVVSFLILFILDFPNLIMSHYTILAGLLASTAILYYILEKKEKSFHLSRIVVIVCMLLCFLLRKQVFFLSLPLGGIIFLHRILQGEGKVERKSEGIHSGIMVGSILVAAFLFWIADSMAYKSPEWKEFKKYNEARTDIFDYYQFGYYYDFINEYENMGLTEMDYDVLMNYNNQLIPNLDTKALEGITALWRIEQKRYHGFRASIKYALFNLLNELYRPQVQPIGFLLTLAFAQILTEIILRKKRKEGISAVLFLFYFLGMIFILLFKKRFPEHVSFDLSLMTFTALAGLKIQLMQAENSEKKQSREIFFGISIMIALLFFSSIRIYRTMENRRLIAANLTDWKFVNEYCRSHNENVYLLSTKSFVYSTEGLFQKDNIEALNTVRLGTWVEQSPLQAERNKMLGIDCVFEDFLENKNCCLIQLKEDKCSWIERFYEQRDILVQANVEDEFVSPSGRVYQVVGIRRTDEN